jgi:hypothetical protein
MKQFLRKITLEQVINNAQVLLSSVAKKGEMEEIEGKLTVPPVPRVTN